MKELSPVVGNEMKCCLPYKPIRASPRVLEQPEEALLQLFCEMRDNAEGSIKYLPKYDKNISKGISIQILTVFGILLLHIFLLISVSNRFHAVQLHFMNLQLNEHIYVNERFKTELTNKINH